jgi:membrane-associated phospholipid phosphatase
MFVVGGLLLIAVVVVGVKLQSVTGPVAVDAAASSQIAQHQGVGGRVALKGSRAAIQLGNVIPVLIGTALLMLWAARRRDLSGVVVAVVGPSLTIFFTEVVLKPLIDRTSPKGTLSYPSGHVAVVVAMATVALLLVYRYEGPRLTLLWSPVAAGATAAIAFAVVALRWHYVTDSFAGIALGAGVVLMVAGLADTVAARETAT